MNFDISNFPILYYPQGLLGNERLIIAQFEIL